MKWFGRVTGAVVMAVSLGLAGCAFDADIPPEADVVAAGGQMLSYTPSERGTIYVYDATEDRLMYSAPVQAGEKILLDPGDNELTIGGRKVLEENLNRGNQIEIRFDPND